MKTLEFENTQGINLQYTIANTMERVIAYVLDAIILALFFLVTAIIFQPEGDGAQVYFAFVFIPPFFFYAVLMEWLNDGRSLGKMAIGLKVVRVDGRPVSGYDYLMRWLFRWLDIYLSSWLLAPILVAATPRGQRLGDILADTTVIQTRTGRISLKRVLKLGQLKKYVPVYPQVLELSENQMMTVKEVINRNKRYPSHAHFKARAELSNRLRSILDIDDQEDDRVLLEILVKDYITLSR
ncbi:MAG: RDD family protein [Flavobacteriales bacterium]|nr:RDD family protein [Flavobacteriales bacterium]